MNKKFKKTTIAKILVSAISVGVLGGYTTLASAQSYAMKENSSAQGIVRISLTKKLAKQPVMFHIQGTNKIIIDLYGIDRNTFTPPSELENSIVEKVSAKIIDDRARIMMETKKPVKFSSILNEGSILIRLVESDKYENLNSGTSEQIKEEKPISDVVKTLEKKKVESLPLATTVNVEDETKPLEAKSIEIKEDVKPIIVTEEVKPTVTKEEIKPVAVEEEIKPIIKEEAKPIVIKEEIKPVIKEEVKPIVVKEEIKPVVIKEEIKQLIKPSVTENAGAVFSEIEKINFKNIGSRSGRLTVSLSDKNIAPVIVKQDNKLIIDFKGVSIPNELQARMKTETLLTIVQGLDVSMQKNNGRIILEQSAGWDYSFYQMEKQLVVDVKPADAIDGDAKKYTGKPLSLSFQNMDVRAILQVIADFTGLNIMTSDSVAGAMTLRLKDVPWDQALDLVLESRNLQKVKEGNVVWIATRQEVAENNKSRLELKNQKEDLEPLRLEFFQINHYKAEDLKAVLEGKSDSGADALKAGTVRLLSKRGSIGVDPRNNLLFIQDTESNLFEIKKLISRLDIPTRQVLIESKIVIADNKFSKEIGAKFGLASSRNINGVGVGIGGNLVQSGQLASGLTAVNPVSSLPATGINLATPGVIGITLLDAGAALGIELSALEQNNRGKVVSNPRLLTTDNKPAVIEQGTEIPYVTPGTANSPATITFKKAVLSLGVTPQVAPNGKVVMSLKIRKDTIGDLINIQGGGQIPSIDTKNITTEVTVNSGQTVVLGGVYEISNKKDVSKIPFFGDLPIVGNLFKHTADNEVKGELLIFITPYVIDDSDLDANKPNQVKELTLQKK